ncbi:MAG: hypothetical protein J5656_06825 [Clostridia bacterium]|nr:hypothetical protein [Clostridia bacterium]
MSLSQYMPFDFEQFMLIESHYSPSPKMRNNKAYNFWFRSLLERAMSIIDADLPENWEGTTRDFFFLCLFRIGFVCVYYDKKFGVSFQPCSLLGQNLYYQPIEALIANPVYDPKGKSIKLGEEGALLKLTPSYAGINDVIAYYAERLANLDASEMVAIWNSRFPKIALASNKPGAEALKKLYDSISEGEPFKVVSNKQIAPNDAQTKEKPWNLLELEGRKENYILPDILRDFQTIINNFDAEIGIPTLPYQKKERMVSDEASMRSYDGKARSLTWIKTLNATADEVNKVLGKYLEKPLKFELHYDDEDNEAPNTQEVEEE